VPVKDFHFSWIPGRMLADRLTPENLRRHGELAGRLHLHGEGFRPSAARPET
jgi:Ser/Thr protein kinase RdoA (MazF antagonist)